MRLTEKQLNNLINTEIKKKINEAKYNTLYNIVKKCINEAIESGVTDTHFAILKPANKIIFSWDYSNEDPTDLRLFRKDYFTTDIVDNGFDPKDVKVLTKKACIRQGLDPEDETNWSNAFDYKVESVNTSKKPLKEDYEDSEDETEETINFYDFEDICHSNGWDWHNSMDVSNGSRSGVRFVFSQGKGCSFEELIKKLKAAANYPEDIITGTTTHRYAPEQKYYTITVLYQ